MFLSMALMTVSIVVLIASAPTEPHGRILLPPGMRYSVRCIFLPFHLPDGIERDLLLLNLPALGVCKRFDRTAFLQQ